MRVSALIAGAALAFGLVACGDDSSNNLTTPPASALAGSYALKSVDGNALPWTNPDAPQYTLLSLAMTINDDGTWSTTGAYTDGTSGGDHGTVTVSGSSATFVWPGGKSYQASVGDGTFSISSHGHVDLFQKF
jgi:hypothetical protein